MSSLLKTNQEIAQIVKQNYVVVLIDVGAVPKKFSVLLSEPVASTMLETTAGVPGGVLVTAPKSR